VGARLFAARALSSKAETVKAFEADQKALVEAYEACGSNEEFLKLKDGILAPVAAKVGDMPSSMLWTFSRLLSSPAAGAKPAVVAVTGAGTAAGTEALYRIAAGEMLGGSQPVTLQVAGADPAVIKDLTDCAFPLLSGVTAASSAPAALKGASFAIVLEGDYASLGSSVAADALVGVAGCAEAAAVAAKAPAGASVTGITRVLQASAEEQIAAKVGCSPSAVSKVVVWGADVVDVSSALVEGKWAVDVLGGWTPDTTEPAPDVAADALVSHMKDWYLGSDDWVSMAVPAEGSYGLGSGFFYSVPVTCPGGGPVKRVGGIPIAPALAEAMEAQRVALAK
jgi:malate dehydrogenase